MVKKLMKHELRALFRALLYSGVVALLITALGCLFVLGDPNSAAGAFFSVMGMYMAVIVFAMAFIVSVSQFARSLFTGEGYMTFSLPVTPTQLLLAKMFSAIIASLFGFAVALLCFYMAFGALGGLDELGALFNQIGTVITENPGIATEYIIMMIVTVPMGLLFFYLILAVGQLFTKARKGVSFGVGIAAFVVLSLFEMLTWNPLINVIADWNIHFAIWLQTIVYLGVEVGIFFLIRHILIHKVNLLV